MDAVETGSLLLMVPERRGYTVPSRTTWRTIGQSGGMDSQRVELGGKVGKSLYCGFHRKEHRRLVSRFRVGCFG